MSEVQAFYLGVATFGVPMGVFWLIDFMRKRKKQREAENNQSAETVRGQVAGSK